MFEHVKPVPPDPLLGITAAYQRDANPRKVDLGVGEYKEEGVTPIFKAVKLAESRLIEGQISKGYVSPAGSELCNRLITELIFGEQHPVVRAQRVSTVQTPGGSGALRVGLELIRRLNGVVGVWISTPSWANHEPMIRAAGLDVHTFPYYQTLQNAIDFDAMLAAIQKIPSGDVLLLQASCHNPTGADLDRSQWRQVADVVEQRGLFAYIDMAYQGFGEGIDEDAYAVRLFAERMPEILVASSCSKNFGIYRERTGALSVVASGADTATANNLTAALQSHINQISRAMYSMPPAHGAGIVETLLNDGQLKQNWLRELAVVRERIMTLRSDLAEALIRATGGDRFDFIKQQKGMFTFLGINGEQIDRLRDEFSIYMAGSSRINIAGLNSNNIDYAAESVAKVL